MAFVKNFWSADDCHGTGCKHLMSSQYLYLTVIVPLSTAKLWFHSVLSRRAGFAREKAEKRNCQETKQSMQVELPAIATRGAFTASYSHGYSTFGRSNSNSRSSYSTRNSPGQSRAGRASQKRPSSRAQLEEESGLGAGTGSARSMSTTTVQSRSHYQRTRYDSGGHYCNEQGAAPSSGRLHHQQG